MAHSGRLVGLDATRAENHWHDVRSVVRSDFCLRLGVLTLVTFVTLETLGLTLECGSVSRVLTMVTPGIRGLMPGVNM